MQENNDYLYARAEAELEMAERATKPEAVRAHYTLANLYLDRFYSMEVIGDALSGTGGEASKSRSSAAPLPGRSAEASTSSPQQRP